MVKSSHNYNAVPASITKYKKDPYLDIYFLLYLLLQPVSMQNGAQGAKTEPKGAKRVALILPFFARCDTYN